MATSPPPGCTSLSRTLEERQREVREAAERLATEHREAAEMEARLAERLAAAQLEARLAAAREEQAERVPYIPRYPFQFLA